MALRPRRIQDELIRIYKDLDRMKFDPEPRGSVAPVPLRKPKDAADPLRTWKVSAWFGWALSGILAMILIGLSLDVSGPSSRWRVPTAEPKVRVLPYTKLSPNEPNNGMPLLQDGPVTVSRPQPTDNRNPPQAKETGWSPNSEAPAVAVKKDLFQPRAAVRSERLSQFIGNTSKRYATSPNRAISRPVSSAETKEPLAPPATVPTRGPSP